MARLRRADCSGPGFRRVRRGRGLQLPRRGRRPDRRARRRRADPRARHPAGLEGRLDLPLGATATSRPPGSTPPAASSTSTTRTGARRRDAEKFDEMLDFAKALPALREHVAERPRGRRGADARARARLRGAAAGPRLLPDRHRGVRGVTNESFGLATMRKEHVTLEDGDTMVFDYPAKSGKRRIQAVVDPLAIDVVGELKRRRGGGEELLAFKAGPPLARPPLRRHQRVHQGGHRRRLLGQGLPHLERDRAGGGRRWRCPARSRGPRPAASARSRARSRRSPTTSATRPRSAAPPTSTRGCSTPTRAG